MSKPFTSLSHLLLPLSSYCHSSVKTLTTTQLFALVKSKSLDKFYSPLKNTNPSLSLIYSSRLLAMNCSRCCYIFTVLIWRIKYGMEHLCLLLTQPEDKKIILTTWVVKSV